MPFSLSLRQALDFWPRFATVFTALGVIAVSLSAGASEPLHPFLWKYRLIVVDAYDTDESVVSILKDAGAEIDERQVLWFVLGGQEVSTNFEGQLSDSFGHDVRLSYFVEGKTRAVLIGKDGGVKKRDSHFDLRAMFALIDTMPMRQREMQTRVVKRRSHSY